MPHALSTIAAVGVALVLLTGCGNDSTAGTDPSPGTNADGVVTLAPGSNEMALLAVEVVAEYPHDPLAFTQGLVWNDGELLEGTGLTGESTLRRVDLATGEVTQKRDLDPALFGEGLERVGDQLIQLTWKDNVALVYDADSFEPTGTFTYEGEGWGLCQLDDDTLVMSSGTTALTFRDATTFEVTGEVEVTDPNGPVDVLNELECVDGAVLANVWETDRIVRIDPATGTVLTSIDAGGLLTYDESLNADVLNGIAYRDDTDTYLLTGKLWPKVFEVRLVEPKYLPSPTALPNLDSTEPKTTGD